MHFQHAAHWEINAVQWCIWCWRLQQVWFAGILRLASTHFKQILFALGIFLCLFYLSCNFVSYSVLKSLCLHCVGRPPKSRFKQNSKFFTVNVRFVFLTGVIFVSHHETSHHYVFHMPASFYSKSYSPWTLCLDWPSLKILTEGNKKRSL